MENIPWCTGKTPYPTKASAIERIERQKHNKNRRRKRGKSGTILVPYRCRTCNCWHVGGTTRDQQRQNDKFGRIIRKVATKPKERSNGNPERCAAQGGQASVSTLRPEPEAQAGQVTERQPLP